MGTTYHLVVQETWVEWGDVPGRWHDRATFVLHKAYGYMANAPHENPRDCDFVDESVGDFYGAGTVDVFIAAHDPDARKDVAQVKACLRIFTPPGPKDRLRIAVYAS